MKIYSSQLEHDATVEDKSLLNVTQASDAVYNTAHDAFSTTQTEGFYISGGTFDTIITIADDQANLNADSVVYKYLDGKGQERNFKDIIIKEVTYDSTAEELRFWGGNGTTDYELFQGVDMSPFLTAASGAAGAAATNPLDEYLPVKTSDHFGRNEFVDSVVREIKGSSATAATFFNLNPDATVAAGAASFTVTIGGASTIANAFAADYDGNTVDIRVQATGAILSVTVARVGSTAQFTIAPAGGTLLPALATTDVVQFLNGAENRDITGIEVGTSTSAKDLTVWGTFTTEGPVVQKHATITTHADEYLELDVDSVATADKTAGTGGFLVENTYTNTAGVKSAESFAGLRWNGAASQFEYNVATNNAGATGTWVPFLGASSTTPTLSTGLTKFVDTFDDATAGLDSDSDVTYTFAHGITLQDGTTAVNDLTVNVYESGSQIIPKTITTSSGNIVIALPAGHGITLSNLKVVAIG